jgi:hypothetical protein
MTGSPGLDRLTYEHLERIRPGMCTSLAILGAGCLAFGVAAPAFIHHVVTPAAAGLLDSACYEATALGTRCTPRGLAIEFDYWDPTSLLLTTAELTAGVFAMVLAVR